MSPNLKKDQRWHSAPISIRKTWAETECCTAGLSLISQVSTIPSASPHATSHCRCPLHKGGKARMQRLHTKNRASAIPSGTSSVSFASSFVSPEGVAIISSSTLLSNPWPWITSGSCAGISISVAPSSSSEVELGVESSTGKLCSAASASFGSSLSGSLGSDESSPATKVVALDCFIGMSYKETSGDLMQPSTTLRQVAVSVSSAWSASRVPASFGMFWVCSGPIHMAPYMKQDNLWSLMVQLTVSRPREDLKSAFTASTGSTSYPQQ